MPSGTPMDMTNLNPIVFQFMVALMAGVENYYGWSLLNQITLLTTLDLTSWMQLRLAVGVHVN